MVLCWSGGKDSALALHMLRRDNGSDVIALLTTITLDYDRVSMHGVRRTLVEEQARQLGLPLDVVSIGKDASNLDYEAQMKDRLLRHQEQGVSSVAFGDIFLEDVRRYREENLARVGMVALFPLWKQKTTVLARQFIGSGFKAVVTCVDSQALDGRFVGREYDESFLADLPPSVDPCGENGEFHSFVYDGPIFPERIACATGEIVLRNERFYYCDVLLAGCETSRHEEIA